MTPKEIIVLVAQAGFSRAPSTSSRNLIFLRKSSMLRISKNGSWAFYVTPADNKKPDEFGSDLETLARFLKTIDAVP
jgi:hypothetical protein